MKQDILNAIFAKMVSSSFDLFMFNLVADQGKCCLQ